MLYISWLYISEMVSTIKPETNIHSSNPSGTCQFTLQWQGPDCVWVLKEQTKCSGVISTFERMFARGLWEAAVVGAGVFRPLVSVVRACREFLEKVLMQDWPLVAERSTQEYAIQKWPLNARHFPVTELSEMSHRNSSVHDPLVVHCIYKEKSEN